MAHGETADVVVIGGGILGCCAAYHLHKAGAGRVVLLEQASGIGMETTSAGAGFVSLWGADFAHWGTLELTLERYAHQFYRELSAAHEIGLKAVGMARVAVGAEGARLLAAQYEHARTLVSGEEVQLLTPQQLVDLLPTVDAAQVSAALFWPTALRIDAPLAARAIGRELAAVGVEVRTGTEVTGVAVDGGRITGVDTSGGRIATDTVVSATGVWTQRVARMVGAGDVFPLTPLLTWRFVTEPIDLVPADLPMLFFSTYADPQAPDMYVREHQGGLLIGAYPHGSGAPLSHLRQVSPDATPGMLTVPAELLRYADDAVREFAAAWPPLAQARVAERRIGLPTYTPDGRHLLGALDGVQGFFVVGGDNEAGISHGPGLGKMLAELVTTGATSLDTAPYRLDRFATHDHDTPSAMLVLSGYDSI